MLSTRSVWAMALVLVMISLLGRPAGSRESDIPPGKAAPSFQATLARPEIPGSLEAMNLNWHNVLLDQGRLTLTLAEQPLTLTQTRNGLGSEYFDYAAFSFQQMATRVNDPAISEALMLLSSRVRESGFLVHQSGQTWFDGTPTGEMTHIHVRSQIMMNLNELNTNAVHLVDIDPSGRVSDKKDPSGIKNPGNSLRRLLEAKARLDATGFSTKYPEAAALVDRQVILLSDLALNLELRWESRFYQDKAVQMRIFASQTLPPQRAVLTAYPSRG